MGVNVVFLGLCILLSATWISTAIEESNEPESVKIIEHKKEQQQIALDKKEEAEQRRIEVEIKKKTDAIINRDGFSYFKSFNLPKEERSLVLTHVFNSSLGYFLAPMILAFLAFFIPPLLKRN